MVNSLPAMRETWVWSLLDPSKISWKREWQPTPVCLPGEFCAQRNLVSYRVAKLDTTKLCGQRSLASCRDTESQTQLSDFHFPFHFTIIVMFGWIHGCLEWSLHFSVSLAIQRIGILVLLYFAILDFSDGSDSKVSAYDAGDLGLIPGLGSPGEGNGTLLQYSCLENPMDGGAWWATVYGVAKSQTRLSN